MNYTMKYQRQKSKRFGEALDEFDRCKAHVNKMLDEGNISAEKAEEILRAKAIELDL